MALPVTITGISTAVAVAGPFQVAAGSYSAVAIDNIISPISVDPLTGTGAGSGLGLRFSSGPITIPSVVIGYSAVGSPTGDVYVEITATDPTGAVLATSTGIPAATGNFTFVFPSPPTTTGTTFGVRLRRTVGDAVNYLQLSIGGGGVGTAYKYNGTTWSTSGATPWFCKVNSTAIIASDAYYFFGRDGTTGTTLQAFKSTAPDTSWASIATRTGFTTAILNLAAYQSGADIHLLVQDGTASTSQAVKYVSFNALNDTFLATTETVSAAASVTGATNVGGFGCSLVVRSNGEVVAFYNGVATKTSGTNYSRVYYRRRTGVNTYGTETQVDANVALNTATPFAVLGAANRVHFVWTVAPSNMGYRTLSAANALNTAGSQASAAGSPGDGVSYDRSGTTKVVVTSNGTGQAVMRFDSSDNPTPSFSTPTAANATIPHRIGVDISTDEVTIAYRNQTDNDLYAIKSNDDGATFGTAVSLFVGTVASADANLSRSASGSMYLRGSNFVVGYVVNDNGTLKYNEFVVRSNRTDYADTITPSSVPIGGATLTDVFARSDTISPRGILLITGALFPGLAFTDTITASSVPVVGATITPVFPTSTLETITPSAVPVGGAVLADVFANIEPAITVGTLPVGGATLADVFARLDTITASALPIGGAALVDVFARLDTIAASAVPITGATVAPIYSANYSDTLAPSAVPIGGATLTAIYTARYSDTLSASAVPITGQDVAPIYSAGSIGYTDTITASGLPVGGAVLSGLFARSGTLVAGALPVGGLTLADTFGRSDTISASAVPVGGLVLADVFARLDTISAGAVPIGGSTVSPIYTARYSDAITASAVPIDGQALTPVWSAGAINYSDTIAASAVPISGAAVAPVYTANTADTLTPSSVPLVGATLTAIYTARYSETITASAVPITGQAITPVFSAGSIGYTDTIVAGSVPVVGATLGDVWARTEAITSSSLPVDGAVLADTFARFETISTGTLPLVGATLAPVFASGYSDAIAASALPISGAAITDRAVYHVTISAGALPIVGTALVDAFGRTDALAPGAVPLVGAAVAPTYVANYLDTLAPGAVPISGAEIVPVHFVGSRRYDRAARVLHLARSVRSNVATDVRIGVQGGSRRANAAGGARSNVAASRRTN